MAKEDQKSFDETARPANGKRTAEVTYIPGDGDPPKVRAYGYIEFRANVPVTIPLDKTISAPMRVEHYEADGTLKSRGVEKKVSIVELARGNPIFSVDGVQAQRKAAMQRLPTDSDQYRGYALAWIRQSNTRTQLDQRWEGEAELRERCGLADKDIAYLSPFLEARRDQVTEAA